MASAPTVLGLPGAWAGDALEACTHYTTKVGGVPVGLSPAFDDAWFCKSLVGLRAEESGLSKSWLPGAEPLLQDGQLTCQACRRRLGLVVQAYAPLYIEGREIPERTLYIFGCLSSDCGHNQESWRVFRVQREDSGVRTAEAASQATTLDTSNDDRSASEAGAQSWWQDDSWGGGASRAAIGKKANEGTDDETREETDAHSRPLGTSSKEPSFSEQNTTGNASFNHAELEAGGDFESGQRQLSDAHERTGGHASNDGWDNDSWGASGGSEWGTDGSALDMSALSEAIAQVADSANRKAERNRMTSAGPAEEEDGGGGSRQGGPDVSRTSVVTSSVLPCFYILAAEEPLEKKKKEAQMKRTVDEGPGGESWEGEGYEYDSALSADRTFLRFRKRVERAPEQCIRYGFNSQPLLARALTDPPPPCTACGAPRTFEMQLMPPLPYFLAEASEEAAGQVAGWEWLTLLVYTCSKACCKPASGSHVALIEEALVYQHELESTRS